ncbi:MAG TPA: pantoate--beta-alanine ligase, partial [Gemmatimonadales bacterium]|nr:pantoate--beta-alanine ligase [Gemmatimonadales bacterium]
FVNPLQFAPGEDYQRYPREPAQDRAMARARDVDCLFAPTPEAMYAQPPAIRLEPGDLIARLCGPRRPGHFQGVLLVVAKLFHLVAPDVAVFGRKDAQQAVLVRRMVSDLSFPTVIDVAPVVREADGVALSSRNAYLAPSQRMAARQLSAGLEAAHQAFRAGEVAAPQIIQRVRDVVRSSEIALEYVEAVDPGSLQPMDPVQADTLLALAARVGPARLIDNITLGAGLAGDEFLGAGGGT